MCGKYAAASDEHGENLEVAWSVGFLFLKRSACDG